MAARLADGAARTVEDLVSDISALFADGLQRHEEAVGLLRGAPLRALERLVGEMHRTLAAGGKILACGNGGSASDAQHLAAELVGRYLSERRPFAAVALNADTSILTCVANDYSFERVFARQVEALGRPGDLLLAISTSGKSPNILEALRAGSRFGLPTAALLGRDGGPAGLLADLSVVVPAQETARIQECHALMIHLLCEALDTLVR